MSDTCSTCGTELETPLCCTSCGALFELQGRPTAHELFGLPNGFAIDLHDLRKRLRRFGRCLHPDFFATAEPRLRELAERNSAALNEAYEVLADDARRADDLVRRLGGPGEDTERQMPQEFLLEVLEWNEALEEARAGGDDAELDALEATLATRRADTLTEVTRLLDPLPEAGAPELTEVRRHLNALRYLDKTLVQIRELRLERANTR